MKRSEYHPNLHAIRPQTEPLISSAKQVFKTTFSRSSKRTNLKMGVTRKYSMPNFPKNEHFVPRRYEMLVFRKTWLALFSFNTRFEVQPFALLPKNPGKNLLK